MEDVGSRESLDDFVNRKAGSHESLHGVQVAVLDLQTAHVVTAFARCNQQDLFQQLGWQLGQRAIEVGIEDYVSARDSRQFRVEFLTHTFLALLACVVRVLPGAALRASVMLEAPTEDFLQIILGDSRIRPISILFWHFIVAGGERCKFSFETLLHGTVLPLMALRPAVQAQVVLTAVVVDLLTQWALTEMVALDPAKGPVLVVAAALARVRSTTVLFDLPPLGSGEAPVWPADEMSGDFLAFCKADMRFRRGSRLLAAVWDLGVHGVRCVSKMWKIWNVHL